MVALKKDAEVALPRLACYLQGAIRVRQLAEVEALDHFCVQLKLKDLHLVSKMESNSD